VNLRLLAFLPLLISSLAGSQTGLALKNGDRVVLYGDSITDNGGYLKFSELFLRLRHPELDVKLFNAGVGGDRVTGGWMGPVDVRMTRDLFARRPTVITIMLGMNDGSYRASDPNIQQAFQDGYRKIVARIKKEAPSARVFLIRPSPYDDVTRQPGFPGGYNRVMQGYGDFVELLARENLYASVDFNMPLVQMLERAKAANPELSARIIGDRVHPGTAGQLAMAQQLLLAWGASPVVSNVKIDASLGRSQAFGAKVANMDARESISWTQTDSGLPFPVDRKDAITALVLQSIDFDQKLNQQMLAVANLTPGTYDLKIDGAPVGKFSSEQLAGGINLALYETPMLAQARAVWNAVWQRADLYYHFWRDVEFQATWADEAKRSQMAKAVNELSDDMVKRAREMALPKPHKFELTRLVG
jgi:lysophospholipase L1-like esterase